MFGRSTKECAHLDQIACVTPSTEECLQRGDTRVQSFQPGDGWIWCHFGRVVLETH